MELYNNSQSDVSQYQLGDDYIVVRFKGGKSYTYTVSTSSEDHVSAMKFLAVGNKGLNTYINIHHPGFVGQVKPIREPEKKMLFALKKQGLSPKTKKTSLPLMPGVINKRV